MAVVGIGAVDAEAYQVPVLLPPSDSCRSCTLYSARCACHSTLRPCVLTWHSHLREVPGEQWHGLVLAQVDLGIVALAPH